MKRLSCAQWKDALAREGRAPRDVLLVRGAAAVLAKDGASGQRFTFTISTEDVDRMGDTVSVSGWELANYRRNPVVLFAHDAGRPPVARAVSVAVRGKELVATVEFPPAGVHPEADLLRELYARGFMRAVSVAFLPLEWERSSDPDRPNGFDFLRQELYEFSLVPVPANPEALIGEQLEATDERAAADLARDAFRDLVRGAAMRATRDQWRTWARTRSREVREQVASDRLAGAVASGLERAGIKIIR